MTLPAARDAVEVGVSGGMNYCCRAATFRRSIGGAFIVQLWLEHSWPTAGTALLLLMGLSGLVRGTAATAWDE